MNVQLVAQSLGWVWMCAGTATLLFLAMRSVTIEADSDFTEFLMLAVLTVVGIATLVAGCQMIGYAQTALWLWRIASVTCIVFSLYAITRPRRVFRAVAASVLNVLIAVFMAAAWLFEAHAATASLPLRPQTVLLTVDGVRAWDTIALLVFATITLLSVRWCVRAVERGIAPSIESHWGGIGGGVSAWRVSASVVYLVLAVTFGLLFAIFVQLLGARTASGTSPVPVTAPTTTR
jgi:hypothetical protein